MIDLPHEKCYGCRACLNICPKNAISMVEDDYGYLYPHVDDNKCIKCGLCIKACPELNSYELNEPLKIYALYAKDNEIVKTSASGGFAAVLSKFILTNGGVVYGCSEENIEEIGHIRIDNLADLSKIQNSKYVHSDIRLTYREVKKDLIAEKIVLFTGTPCQISGLYGFLGKNYENLITMDLLCHGVPPLRMLKEQVFSYKECKGINPKDIRVDFRWKEPIRSECGSIRFGLRTAIRSGESYRIIRKENDIVNPYMRCFQTGISLRENCLQCPYANKKRIADVTAADFWGLGRDIPSEMFDMNGVSLLLINTQKGMRVFSNIEHFFRFEDHTFEEASLRNRCLYKPFKRLSNRDRFLELYKEKGLIYAAKETDPIHKFESNTAIKWARKRPLTNLGARAVSKLMRTLHLI